MVLNTGTISVPASGGPELVLKLERDLYRLVIETDGVVRLSDNRGIFHPPYASGGDQAIVGTATINRYTEVAGSFELRGLLPSEDPLGVGVPVVRKGQWKVTLTNPSSTTARLITVRGDLG